MRNFPILSGFFLVATFGLSQPTLAAGPLARQLPVNSCFQAYKKDASADKDVSAALELIADMNDDFDYPTIDAVVLQVREALRLPEWKSESHEDPLNVIVVNTTFAGLTDETFNTAPFCNGKPWRIQRLTGWIIQQVATALKSNKSLQQRVGVDPNDI